MVACREKNCIPIVLKMLYFGVFIKIQNFEWNKKSHFYQIYGSLYFINCLVNFKPKTSLGSIYVNFISFRKETQQINKKKLFMLYIKKEIV